ncbi:hypothetical protein N7468_005346 [Penicillium chermesinum]|uniref:CHCH domain-containing protein n=1 Tax=Penicillium chermesinum TaxID=63820 RepID=A0A9W9TMW8_9EURO|nr:uncharacterized protein N7468_005346 [Penicillium chermesinum]KAJ5232390.1 hypothetical protein N7468_005346 [Penicillium chermesinum]
MSNNAEKDQVVPEEDDDEPDDCASSVLAAMQDKMNDCYYAKRDWRACKDEMEAFRECWKRQGNDKRTETKDA